MMIGIEEITKMIGLEEMKGIEEITNMIGIEEIEEVGQTIIEENMIEMIIVI